MTPRPTLLEIIRNMREKNFREEIILEEVEKELNRLDSSHPEQGEQGELYKWVKASENLPEFENRDKGYVVRYPNIPDTLAVWRWDWINQRIDNNCDLEILVKLSSPPPEGQDELWQEFYNELKPHIVLTAAAEIKKLKSKYLLIKK